MNFEEYITHAGVKGMKWGVRKDKKTSSGQNESKVSKVKTRVKEEWGSRKRERSWNKEYDNLDKMSLPQMRQMTARIQLENDLKRLAKTKKVGSDEDKKAYRTRDKLSDKELMDRVVTLRTKDNFKRQVDEASREQREIGQRIVNTAASVGLSYMTTGIISTKDIGLAAMQKPNLQKWKREQMEHIIRNNNYTLVDDNR